MDLRNMLNDAPPPPPPPQSPRHHPLHHPPQHPLQHPLQRLHPHHHSPHEQNHRPTPPPLQPPRSPFQSPAHGGPGGGYPQHPQSQSQSQSPYQPSPPPNRHFPFPPPPPSPHTQHHHQQQQQQHPQQHPQQNQQGYVQSPSTPHPLSAHTVHSLTPTSSISSSPHNHFPQSQGIQYANQQQQQQHHPLHPPPSPHQYHSQHHQQQQQQGYPRQSPIQQSPLHSPIGGRPQLIHAGSSGANDRPIPTISTPIARRDLDRDRERERERERVREREQLERREREREREREQQERVREQERERQREQNRERERDISISPKTRLPVYLPEDEPIPDAPKEEFSYPGQQNSRPNSQHRADGPGPGGYTRPRRGSSAAATSNHHDRRNLDAMDVDGRDPTPGVPAVPERKWGGPVADRKLNGSAGIGNGRDAPSQQLAPQQPQPQHNPLPSQQHHTQQPPPPPPPPLITTTSSSSNPSSTSSQRTSTVSPSIKDQPHQPPPITRSTPTPTNLNSRPHPPPPPSPKPNQQLGPPPTPTTAHAVEGNSSSPGSGGPPRKRPRRDEAPIWARKASRSSSSSPVMANRRQPGSGGSAGPPQSAPPPQQQNQGPPPPPPPPPPPQQQQQQQQAQHPPQQHPQQHQHRPMHTGPQRTVPLFGPWESSICNAEPHEELTRAIADFLFKEVIMRHEAAAAGGDTNTPLIEIEAKIGHLIDKNTNARLRLPVMTETVMDDRDNGWRVNFKSSMTEHQHKHLNRYLNKLFEEAKAPPNAPPPPSPSSTNPPAAPPPPPPTGPKRIPMDYIHTHECDSFYELPANQIHALPKMLREHLNPRFKTKVRVTKDQRSGKILNKIVKARIADCNVYSPRTQFDWRVSVNMEMPWGGDVEGLTAMAGGGDLGGEGVRMKDRLSYKHLAYQIDLTQVTDGVKASKKEHELEIEVSGEEVKRHGQLASQQKPNAYEALVKGFVDNVRVLIRGAAPPEPVNGCGCSVPGRGRE